MADSVKSALKFRLVIVDGRFWSPLHSFPLPPLLLAVKHFYLVNFIGAAAEGKVTAECIKPGAQDISELLLPSRHHQRGSY